MKPTYSSSNHRNIQLGTDVLRQLDITALSDDAPSLFDPAVATPHLIAVSLCLSGIFFILFTVFALRATWGNRLFSTWLLTQLDRPMALRVSTWLGLSGFVIGVSLKYLP